MKLIAGLFSIFIVMPIWFYILYSILTEINASELTWFLYWVYLPVALFVGLISKYIEDK